MKQRLFQLAKSKWMGKAVGYAFRLCPWAIPGKKLYCSNRILAMEHPRPVYLSHVILSPRKPIADLPELGQKEHAVYVMELWKAVVYLATQHAAYSRGFTLVANGGKRQEVGQVHFHLFIGQALVSDAEQELQKAGEYSSDAVCVYRPALPEYDLHLMIEPKGQSCGEGYAPADREVLGAALEILSVLAASHSLTENGYSLICQHRPGNDLQHPVFHLISGKRRKSSRR